ncbi:hypothetical protein ABG768_009498 [Culter alburnus]|uniref:Uncharacterized protein n=1 Tax=Culter alburnus TaxID=194366 RepID=A0AAW1ZDD9_CULAL
MAAGSGSGMDYSTGSRSGSEFMVGFGLESLAGSHSDSGSVVAGVTSGVGALSGGIGPGMRGMVMKVVEYKGNQPASHIAYSMYWRIDQLKFTIWTAGGGHRAHSNNMYLFQRN